MKWLIVEDALRDHWGHWVEYLRTFQRGLKSCGDELTILCDRGADADLVSEFEAEPVLPQSIWHRMSDGAGALRRYARVPGHAFATFFALRKVLRGRRVKGKESRVASNDRRPEVGGQRTEVGGQETVTHAGVPDLIFVPTVLVHHLLGWWMLLKTRAVPKSSRVLLFFPNLPLRMDEKGEARWNNAPTTKLMARLFRAMRPWIEERRVILGVETKAMRSALAQLTGLPVLYLPHPVDVPPTELAGIVASEELRVKSNEQVDEVTRGELRVARQGGATAPAKAVVFGCYGAARAEKGSDILQAAIRKVLEEDPEIPAGFAFQWVEDFDDGQGRRVKLDALLKNHPKVEVINRYFQRQEYGRQLARTDAMVLPYQSRSYRVRVSRVVIEAMVHGLPVVTTEGTTMWNQVGEFGAGLPYVEGDARSLADAIRKMAAEFAVYRAAAQNRAPLAREHFSVATFRELLLAYLEADQLVLGDSHVAAWDWASVAGRTWAYGVPGATSQQLLERVKQWRVSSPNRLLLWVGTNDVLQGVPPEHTAANVDALLEAYQGGGDGRRASILEVPPLGRKLEEASARNEVIRRVNNLLARQAGRSGVSFIRWAAEATDADGFLDDRVTADGTHLNERGYEKVAAALAAGARI